MCPGSNSHTNLSSDQLKQTNHCYIRYVSDKQHDFLYENTYHLRDLRNVSGWERMRSDILEKIFRLTHVGILPPEPQGVKSRPLKNGDGDNAHVFVPVDKRNPLSQLQIQAELGWRDSQYKSCCVEVVVSSLPPPSPGALRLILHPGNNYEKGPVLGSKKILDASAGLLATKGLTVVLGQLGLLPETDPDITCLYWVEEGAVLNEEMLIACCKAVHGSTHQRYRELNIVVGKGAPEGVVKTSHSCQPHLEHERDRIKELNAGSARPAQHCAGDILDNSLAASCDLSMAPCTEGLILLRVIVEDGGKGYLQFVNNFQGMDKATLDKFTMHGGGNMKKGPMDNQAFHQEYLLNLFNTGAQNTIYSMGSGYAVLTMRSDCSYVRGSRTSLKPNTFVDDEASRQESWTVEDTLRASGSADVIREQFREYPCCIAELQIQLEEQAAHFTSIVIEGLSHDCMKDICEREGHRQMAKKLRDKYLFYFGRQEHCLQFAPKPFLPERLGKPSKMILELIDLRGVNDPSSVTFDFTELGTCGALQRFDLGELPWEGWPYSEPPDSEFLEGDIEQLLRLSRTNMVKKPVGGPRWKRDVSSLWRPPCPEHYKARSYLYSTDLENAYAICATMDTERVEYGNVMFVTFVGPQIAGASVFRDVLRSMCEESRDGMATFAYICGRWAAAEACNIHPSHVELALRDLHDEEEIDLRDRVFTIAFFQSKQAATMNGDKFKIPLSSGFKASERKSCARKRLSKVKRRSSAQEEEDAHPWFKADLDAGSWKPRYDEERKTTLSAVVKDFKQYIRSLCDQADARYFRAGEQIGSCKINEVEHVLWSGITDGKGTRLEKGCKYRIPLKNFPIRNSGNKRLADGNRKSFTKVFYVQKPKAPQGGCGDMGAILEGLAVRKDVQAPEEEVMQQPVSKGYLVVQMYFPPNRRGERFYLHLSGALQTIRTLDVQGEAKDLQKCMPFHEEFRIQVENGYTGVWETPKVCQRLSFSQSPLYPVFLPRIRLHRNNTHAIDWSMASQSNPMAKAKLFLRMHVMPEGESEDSKEGAKYDMNLETCKDKEHIILEKCKLNDFLNEEAKPRPGDYRATFCCMVTTSDEPLSWPNLNGSEKQWDFTISRFVRLCAGEPQSVEVSWPDISAVSLEEQIVIDLRVWDSLRSATRLLCSSSDIMEKAREAVSAIFLKEDSVELRIKALPEWVEEERGRYIRLNVSLDIAGSCDVTGSRSSGKELEARFTVAKSILIPDQVDNETDAVKNIWITPGAAHEIVLDSSDMRCDIENGSSPGIVAFCFADRHGLPTSLSEEGWVASLVLTPDDGELRDGDDLQLSVSPSQHKFEMEVPALTVVRLPEGGTSIELSIEAKPVQNRRCMRHQSAHKRHNTLTSGNYPVSFRISASDRPARMNLFHGEACLAECRFAQGRSQKVETAHVEGKAGTTKELRVRIFSDRDQPSMEDITATLGDEDMVKTFP
mmetsp:Transcript_14111/g.33311  ORF Transcript_14111/g.33311 Transcript_14111/m.33311 type:complete len:1465 (+) Transcript_14111:154-4548(+)